jgi:hypothetical protein
LLEAPEHAACLEALRNPTRRLRISALAGFRHPHRLLQSAAAAASELTLGLRIVTTTFAARRLPAAVGKPAPGVRRRHLRFPCATFARRKGARRIVTRNPSRFAAAPDLGILTPQDDATGARLGLILLGQQAG